MSDEVLKSKQINNSFPLNAYENYTKSIYDTYTKKTVCLFVPANIWNY